MSSSPVIRVGKEDKERLADKVMRSIRVSISYSKTITWPCVYRTTNVVLGQLETGTARGVKCGSCRRQFFRSDRRALQLQLCRQDNVRKSTAARPSSSLDMQSLQRPRCICSYTHHVKTGKLRVGFCMRPCVPNPFLSCPANDACDTMWLGKISCHHVRLPNLSFPSFDWLVEKDPERFRRVTRGSWRLVWQGCKAKDGPTGLEVSAA
jgi:hypothetical protein